MAAAAAVGAGAILALRIAGQLGVRIIGPKTSAFLARNGINLTKATTKQIVKETKGGTQRIPKLKMSDAQKIVKSSRPHWVDAAGRIRTSQPRTWGRKAKPLARPKPSKAEKLGKDKAKTDAGPGSRVDKMMDKEIGSGPRIVPKPKPRVQPKPKPKPKPQPKAKPKPKPKPQPKPKPRVKPKPKPKPKPRVQPKPKPKPKPRVQPKPRVKPKPKPRVQPKPRPKPKPRPSPIPRAGSGPKPRPLPKPRPRPKQEVLPPIRLPAIRSGGGPRQTGGGPRPRPGFRPGRGIGGGLRTIPPLIIKDEPSPGTDDYGPADILGIPAPGEFTQPKPKPKPKPRVKPKPKPKPKPDPKVKPKPKPRVKPKAKPKPDPKAKVKRKEKRIFDDVEGYDRTTGRYGADTDIKEYSLKDLLRDRRETEEYDTDGHKRGGKVGKGKKSKARKRAALRGWGKARRGF